MDYVHRRDRETLAKTFRLQLMDYTYSHLDCSDIQSVTQCNLNMLPIAWTSLVCSGQNVYVKYKAADRQQDGCETG